MDPITQLDGNLLIGIQRLLNADWLTPIMKAITFCGEYGWFWVLVCIILVICRRTRRLGIICSVSLLLSFLVCNACIKPMVGRIRPWVTFQLVDPLLPDPGDPSFPSGHSTHSMGTAWAMFLATLPVKTDSGKSYDGVRCLGWKGEGASPQKMHMVSIAAVIFTLLMGLSRLYLGMHYPSDVICGFLIGMIIATAVYKIILSLEDKHGMMDSWLSKDPEATK